MIIFNSRYGGLAQLARAPALQAGGQEFDSLILHQKSNTNCVVFLLQNLYSFLNLL